MNKISLVALTIILFAGFASAAEDSFNPNTDNISAATYVSTDCIAYVVGGNKLVFADATTHSIVPAGRSSCQMLADTRSDSASVFALSKPLKALAKIPVTITLSGNAAGKPLLGVGTDNKFYAVGLNGSEAEISASNVGIDITPTVIDSIEFDYLAASRGTASLWIIYSKTAGSGIGTSTNSGWLILDSTASGDMPSLYLLNLITEFNGVRAALSPDSQYPEWMLVDISGNVVLGYPAGKISFRYERSAPTLSRKGTPSQVLKPWNSQASASEIGTRTFVNDSRIDLLDDARVTGRVVHVIMEVENTGNTTWTSGANTPLDYYDDFHVRVRKITLPNGVSILDPAVSNGILAQPVVPGETITKRLVVPLSTEILEQGGNGTYTLTIGVVQESIEWIPGEIMVEFEYPGTPPSNNCGDGVCQTSLGENAVTCPADCSGPGGSGSGQPPASGLFCGPNSTFPVSGCATSGETMYVCNNSFVSGENNVGENVINGCAEQAENATACAKLEAILRIVTNNGNTEESGDKLQDWAFNAMSTNADDIISGADAVVVIEAVNAGVAAGTSDLVEADCANRVGTLQAPLNFDEILAHNNLASLYLQ